MNNELEINEKEAVVAYFKIPCQYIVQRLKITAIDVGESIRCPGREFKLECSEQESGVVNT